MAEPRRAVVTDGGASGPADSRRTGFGRVLITIYAILALGATARSITELISKYHVAPLAYWLSLFSGVVYILATYGLASRRPSSWRLAVVTITIEAIGVLVIGTWSVVHHASFPKTTVWSDFGAQYGGIPLVLPFVGLWWLRRTRADRVTAGAR
ncbi:MAG: hypothetical protein QOF57_1495 [Frankiaceae bacterium]|nr:hypothetical protein [Frankiaceae bacterium]